MPRLKPTDLDVLMPPGTLIDDAWRDIRTWRGYAHISIDLWRTPYNLNAEGSKKVGEFLEAYSKVWIARSIEGMSSFPRRGIMYSPAPTTSVSMTICRDDVEFVTRHLWRLMTNKKHLTELSNYD